jgi:hypothetical protein
MGRPHLQPMNGPASPLAQKWAGLTSSPKMGRPHLQPMNGPASPRRPQWVFSKTGVCDVTEQLKPLLCSNSQRSQPRASGGVAGRGHAAGEDELLLRGQGPRGAVTDEVADGIRDAPPRRAAERGRRRHVWDRDGAHVWRLRTTACTPIIYTVLPDARASQPSGAEASPIRPFTSPAFNRP